MRVNHCRACHGKILQPFLDLGRTALANRFLKPEDPDAAEPSFPLRVVLCVDCGLVQIDEEVPPEVLFKNYVYVSGTSDFIREHAAWLAKTLCDDFHLRPGDLVVEAASNDGTILRAFQERGLEVLGIEPAENIAAEANGRNVPTLCDFFNLSSAGLVREQFGPAKLILARHVLAHVADLHGFVAGLGHVLGPEGVAAVEFPHLLPFFENLEYDTVYHEHLCYLSVRVVKTLFERFGLEVIDAKQVAIHGGSVVVIAQRRGGPWKIAPALAGLLQREEDAGLHRLEPWLSFARRVADNRAALLDEIARLQRAGKLLAGYGAPAKGMTLLSYCGIDKSQLPYLVDKSPHKQGLLTPGHHIPIFGPEKLLADQPDVVLILAWNFADEIVRQQAEYHRRGGRLLLPIPMPRYWNDNRMTAAA
jgi:hypothetical protein